MIRKLLLCILLISSGTLMAQQTPEVNAPEKTVDVWTDLPVRELDSSDIYPTLADDFIVIKRNVNEKLIQVRIEDVTGIVFFDKQLEGNRRIDVSDFKTGTYIIKISSPGEIALGQFVKR
ncbi:T9SS type A sorting domain-containing protein [Flavobacteriaceae bacterium M23B6Z8]